MQLVAAAILGVAAAACSDATLDPILANGSDSPLFFDDFEYAADRDDSEATLRFQLNGGWTWAKTIQSTGSHNGYLYTVEAIPGYAGAFPGKESGRVLAMEALPATLGGQTDFYLQYGQPEEAWSEGAVPADVWFQFWLYPNHFGDQPTQFAGRNSLLLPCAAPACSGNRWFLQMGSSTYEPFNQNPLGDPSNGDVWLRTSDQSVGEVVYEDAEEWNAWKLGQTDISEHVAANRWTLVKVHFDTSSTSGSFEAWLRPLGGEWTKVAEWIDGVTPRFRWTLKESDVGGHRAFRLPVAINDYDAWVYMDDFAMAVAEDDLPVY